MPSSLEWRMYYEANAATLLEIPWDAGAELDAAEKTAVARSVREFQAGESSEGWHLLNYSQRYAEASGDHEYLAAIVLFIKEEQRHARDLAHFMELNGIALVKTTFPDRVFRRLRCLLNGLECSIAVLITAEIIAKVYYAALREATRSRVLRGICDQILRDELRHVQFQADQIARLRAGRRGPLKMLTMGLQQFLFLGTVLVVWLFHSRTIKRGGMTFGAWWAGCWREFAGAFVRPLPAQILEPPAAEA